MVNRLIATLSLFLVAGGKKTGKSVRRKQKDSAWWAKQKEKEKERKQAVAEETKKVALCKYYLNGNCKNVR